MSDPAPLPEPPRPHLGLVCITTSDEVRYRTITRASYLKLPEELRPQTLRALYRDNLDRLFKAITYCGRHSIRLYRVTSQLFPMSDLGDGVGDAVLEELLPDMARVGPYADELGVRVVVHPDQYVVLSSDSPLVVDTSIAILADMARAFDRFGLPRSTWSAMNIHGGKSGKSDQLVEVIRGLPENIRSRLTLENDEHAYGADAILEVCRRAEVPFVFDVHHHVVNAKLPSYEDESVFRLVAAARETWHPPEWQMVHLSNGRDSISDRRHHDLVTELPSSFRSVPWIEVEAKTKELAIERLRADWPGAD